MRIELIRAYVRTLEKEIEDRSDSDSTTEES